MFFLLLYIYKGWKGQYILNHLSQMLSNIREGDSNIDLYYNRNYPSHYWPIPFKWINRSYYGNIELWKAHLAVRISKLNAEVAKQENDNDPPKVIGFTIPNEEEDDDNESGVPNDIDVPPFLRERNF